MMLMKRAQREALIGYLLLVPGLLGLVVLVGIPLVRGIALSFTDRYLLEPSTGKFIGLQNYVTFVQHPLFLHYIQTTAFWVIGSMAGKIGIGLALALLLNKPLRFRGIYRALALVPWVMPMVAAGVVWRWIFDGGYGVLNYMLFRLGIIEQYVIFLAEKEWVWPSIFVIAWWKGYPFAYAVILAGLQVIPRELYEAGEIDGTTSWTSFLNITLPLLRPVLFVLILLETIWTANDFTSIWILTQGGPPPDYTMTLTPLVYMTYSRFDRTGYAAAIAVILMLIMMVFTVFYVRRVRADTT
jgi:multiple sugar transport system permease protein